MDPFEFAADAGRRLRALRRDRGVSLRHLADAAGVNVSVASLAERGRDARLSTWFKLFEALGYDLRLTTEEADDEYVGFLTDESERRRERRREGLCAGKLRW